MRRLKLWAISYATLRMLVRRAWQFEDGMQRQPLSCVTWQARGSFECRNIWYTLPVLVYLLRSHIFQLYIVVHV